MATTVNSPSRDAFVNNLQPCAATGSFFAYAWGNSIVYYRHDSFESRRTLEGHSAKICLLVADAHNQYSVGDIIFSYDESKVAIFWDLLAGNQLVRLMIFENLTAAAWIDQRQMIFGSATGKLIFFDLSNTEHVSIPTIKGSISTLSSARSKHSKLAIGYHDGTILIVRTTPQFSILHRLSFSEGTSPIVNLSWHRSFALLAAQNELGELYCWHTARDTPQLCRKLERKDNTVSGSKWMGWSKNGHLVQLLNQQGPLVVRDIKTRYIRRTRFIVPEMVKGIAIFGPDAMLFVLGAEQGIWQYKLKDLSQVSIIRHLPSCTQTGSNPPLEMKSHVFTHERLLSSSSDYESEGEEGSLWSDQGLSRGGTSASSVIGEADLDEFLSSPPITAKSPDEEETLKVAENAALPEHLLEGERSSGQRFLDSAKRILCGLSWLAKTTRPSLKPGYQRIEWTCDCGVELYADFCVCHSEHIENLARSLKNPIQLITGSEESSSHGPQSTDGSEEGTEAITTSDGHHDTQDSSDSSDGDTSSSTLGSPSTPSTPTSSPTTEAALSKSVATNQPSQGARSKFLALCVNTGGIYKTLSEVDLTGIKSDMAGFLKMKEAYVGTRGLRSRLGFLIKPVTLEFVQFTLWNRKHGYVSICDRPESIPPHTMSDYEYVPKPLEPLPPMPPEIFLHYLEHGEGDLNAARHDWLPRLPLHLGKRVIDGDEACYGYGVHIIEGPNRMTIFWIFMTTMAASVLACVLWTGAKDDIQGGTSLGALIVALPTAVLAAFLFRFEGV